MTIQISFRCPTKGCDCTDVTDHVDDADYDFTDESDGVRTNVSQVRCPYCEEWFDVEVVAKGGEKEGHLLGKPEVKVYIADNTGDYTHILDEQIIDEEIERLRKSE